MVDSLKSSSIKGLGLADNADSARALWGRAVLLYHDRAIDPRTVGSGEWRIRNPATLPGFEVRKRVYRFRKE